MRRAMLVAFSTVLLLSCESMPDPMPAGNGDPSGNQAPPGGQSPPTQNQSPPAVETVLLDGLTVGAGTIVVDPTGTSEGVAFRYPKGTRVTLTAVEAPGWLFVGWNGDIVSADPVVQVSMEKDTYVYAFFVNLQPPPVPYQGSFISANDGQFLGTISSNRFDLDSIANPFGTYGNTFSNLSIWNEFGTYGNTFSTMSPFNAFTTTPPVIVENGVVVAYLTNNTFLSPRVDPDDLARAVGRPEAARD